MQQLELLWEHQQALLALESREHELEQSVVRKKWIRIHNYLLEQQKHLRDISNSAVYDKENLERLGREYTAIIEEYNENIESREKIDESDLEAVEAVLSQSEKIQEKLVSLRKELNALVTGLDEREKNLDGMRIKVSKAKKEHDALKEQMDKEIEDAAGELKELREAAEKSGEGIDEDLMNQYISIRQTRHNAMVKIENNQCSGCNMSLPLVVLRKVNAGGKIVTCENCGRILFS